MKRLSIIALMGLTACGRSGFDQLSVGGDGGGTSDEDAAADGDVTTDPDAVDAPAGGGTVVAQGSPEEVVKQDASFTGFYLKPLLRAAK